MKLEIIRPALVSYIPKTLSYGDIIEVIYNDGGSNFYMIIQPHGGKINFMDLNEFGNRVQDDQSVTWVLLDEVTILSFFEDSNINRVKKVKGKLTLTIEE